jgi:hypothetical protein
MHIGIHHPVSAGLILVFLHPLDVETVIIGIQDLVPVDQTPQPVFLR